MERPHIHPASAMAEALLTDASKFRPGSLDHQWQSRAAWKLAQMGAGIAACDWTDPPADFGHPQQRMAAQ